MHTNNDESKKKMDMDEDMSKDKMDSSGNMEDNMHGDKKGEGEHMNNRSGDMGSNKDSN